MNNDLISREALKKALKSNCTPEICHDYNTAWCESCCRTHDFEDLIDNAPTVADHSVEIAQKSIELGRSVGRTEGAIESQRPQGEWIKITRKGTVPVEYICSCCGRKIYDDYELSIPMSEFYPFCHCGADMRGGAE